MKPPDWPRKFDEPIPLPRRRGLVMLQDAGTYITKLPKAEHAATEALMLVVTSGGPTMLARIGVVRALNRACSNRRAKSIVGESESSRGTSEPHRPTQHHVRVAD